MAEGTALLLTLHMHVSQRPKAVLLLHSPLAPHPVAIQELDLFLNHRLHWLHCTLAVTFARTWVTHQPKSYKGFLFSLCSCVLAVSVCRTSSYDHAVLPYPACHHPVSVPLSLACQAQPNSKRTGKPYSPYESGPLDLGFVVTSCDSIAETDSISFHIFIKTTHLKDKVGPPN